MEINFSLYDVTPFSVNKAYYRRGKSIVRTKECRVWGDDVLLKLQLPEIKKKLKAFSNAVEPSRCKGLEVSIIFYLPPSIMYTKTGKISRRSQDLSNVEKLLIDLIFDPRFHGRLIHEKVITNLNLDDCLVTKLTSEKCVNDLQDQFQIDVSLRTSSL